MKLLFASCLFLLFTTSFKEKPVTTNVYLIVAPFFVKGDLEINEKRLTIKGSTYAEFSVTGDSIDCKLKIKLPVFFKDPPPLKVQGGSDIYILIAQKPDPRTDTKTRMDTISREDYYALKKKSKKQLFPEE